MKTFLLIIILISILIGIISCKKEPDEIITADKELVGFDIDSDLTKQIKNFINFINEYSGSNFVIPDNANEFLSNQLFTKLQTIFNYKIFDEGRSSLLAAYNKYNNNVYISSYNSKEKFGLYFTISDVRYEDLKVGEEYYCYITFIEDEQFYESKGGSIKIVDLSDGTISATFNSKMYEVDYSDFYYNARYATDIEGYFVKVIDIASIM